MTIHFDYAIAGLNTGMSCWAVRHDSDYERAIIVVREDPDPTVPICGKTSQAAYEEDGQY